jgi:hypothetical protein
MVPAMKILRGLRHSTLIKQDMLITIAIVLVVLWLLGVVTAYTLGGFIHILLIIAIIMILIRVIRGEKIL